MRHYNHWKLQFLRAEERLCGGHLISAARFALSWCVPVLYATLFIVLVTIFFRHTYHKVPDPHPVLYTALLAALAVTFILAVFKPPVYHSPLHPHVWRHDNLIFFPSECATCGFQRPPRSRHCRYCGHCMVLYDHHCIWLNNCVGLGNYQWFYSFLLMNVIDMTYGLVIVGAVLYDEWQGWHRLESCKVEMALCFLLASFDVLVIWFTHVQYVLVRDGMTTTELTKWELIHDLVHSKMLYELNGVYFEYLADEDVFVSVNQRDNTIRHVNRNSLKQVTDIKDIVNIYDLGSWKKNLRERLYTEPFQ